jgi:hypothetical protein
MRRRLLTLGIATLTIAGAGTWLLVAQPSRSPAPGPLHVAQFAPPATVATKASAEVHDPSQFTGWAQWETARRTAAITKIVGNPRLDPEIIAFLQRELLNRGLHPGTRNNIANALMGQDERPAGLAEIFMRMVDDPQESITWRDYSVQRLVASLPPGADTAPVADKLLSLIRSGPGSLPGTALIQVDLLLRSGRMPPGPAYADALVQLATAATAPLENRMTAVAKIGERGDPAQLAVVRGLLTPQVEPALLRVAIATLGLIGNDQDRPVVAGYLTHTNRGVVMAATAAIKRLDARSAM